MQTYYGVIPIYLSTYSSFLLSIQWIGFVGEVLRECRSLRLGNGYKLSVGARIPLRLDG